MSYSNVTLLESGSLQAWEEGSGETTQLNAPPQHVPLVVILDGLSLCTVSVALILCLLCLGSQMTGLILALLPVIMYIHNDYHNFLRLGPGGTPSSLKGYLIIAFWRPWTLNNPFQLGDGHLGGSAPSSGRFSKESLPYRDGARPRVVGIAPQRQLDQIGRIYYYKAVQRVMTSLADRYPAKLYTGTSTIEKHGLALFAKRPQTNNCQGEICHVHDSDHSMHMSLHLEDIKHVLEKRWGQRHPLASRSWVLRMPVSPNFVMIYAPRCE